MSVTLRRDRRGRIAQAVLSAEQGVGPIDPGAEMSSVGGGLLEDLDVPLAGLEVQRDDVDRVVLQVELQPARDRLVGGIGDLHEDLVADRVEQAAPRLELGDADVAGLATQADQLDIRLAGEVGGPFELRRR